MQAGCSYFDMYGMVYTTFTFFTNNVSVSLLIKLNLLFWFANDFYYPVLFYTLNLITSQLRF